MKCSVVPSPSHRARNGGVASHRTLWLSGEVREEIEELLLLLALLPGRWQRVFIDAPNAVLSAMHLPEAVAGASVVAMPYRHAIGIGVIRKLWGVLHFGWQLMRRRPQLLISGFSMLKHRAVSGLLRIPHLAYIRGVAFDPGVAVGLSDRVRFGWVGRLIPRRLVQTYSADRVLTVGEVNAEFLRGRGVPSGAVGIVGPVWLEDLISGGEAEEPSASLAAEKPGASRAVEPPAHAYFLTGAWEAHGRMVEHEAQLRLTRHLAKAWSRSERFVLRVHPRDSYPYEADVAFAGVALDRRTPKEFLSSLQAKDLVIAPLSTLAFEVLFLGKSVAFYADPEATRAYLHVYNRLGIDPATPKDLESGNLRVYSKLPVEVFSPIDKSQFVRAVEELLDR